ATAVQRAGRVPGADGLPPDNGDPERQHRHV
ncbi:MAG: hypothetical protein AVDCRST_MAG10-3594, partial [uncultured Acidimicrobiales bacterium]